MRSFHIIIGSKNFFNEIIVDLTSDADSFLDLVRVDDARRNQGKSYVTVQTSCLIIRNTDYHGIVATAHDRLGELIKDFTDEDSEIYIHNPPASLKKQLLAQKEEDEIELEVISEKYDIRREPSLFISTINDIKQRIIGQETAIQDIAKSIWYLTNVDRKKPYVIMLYGNSSLGKTELVREISKAFFNSKYMEKHLSMFKNGNYAEYFFGNEPNRSSMGFELLERESNLVFFDELDKCPETFYSAFYTLFDNTLFKDYTYDVDISGLLIVLTSNYFSMDEMKKALGLPIFYRIDKFIHFEDFSAKDIYEIVKKEIHERANEFAGFFSEEQLYAVVSPQIKASGENARTIKNTIQFAIEEMMFQSIERQCTNSST